MDCSIREATLDDYDALCPLFSEVDAQHREALPHLFRMPAGPARTKEFISDVTSDENAVLFLAERTGEVVGLIHVLVRDARDIPILVPRRYAVIDNLIISKGSRRSGIGRSLVARAEQWAAAKGANSVELNVWEFNKDAVAFYEKLGYATASRRMWKSDFGT